MTSMKKSTISKSNSNGPASPTLVNGSGKTSINQNQESKSEDFIQLLQQQLEVTMNQLVTQGCEIAQLKQENNDLKQNLAIQIQIIEDSGKNQMASEEKVNKLEKQLYIQTEETKMIQQESQERLRFFESEIMKLRDKQHVLLDQINQLLEQNTLLKAEKQLLMKENERLRDENWELRGENNVLKKERTRADEILFDTNSSTPEDDEKRLRLNTAKTIHSEPARSDDMDVPDCPIGDELCVLNKMNKFVQPYKEVHRSDTLPTRHSDVMTSIALEGFESPENSTEELTRKSDVLPRPKKLIVDPRAREKIKEASKSILLGDPKILDDPTKIGLKYEDPQMIRRKITKQLGEKKLKIFNPETIFEDFFVVSLERSDLEQFRKDFGDSTGTMPAKVLWNHAGKESLNEGPKKGVQDFIFPFGVSVADITSDEERQEQISHKALLKEKAYRKRSIFPLLPGRDDIIAAEWDQSVDAMNSHHLLYFIMISTKDFIALEGGEGQEGSFFETNYVFCFMTYYPIVHLFLNIIKQILNLFRSFRKNLFLKDTTALSKCDLISSLEEFTSPLKIILDSLKSYQAKPQYGKKFEIKIETPLEKPISGSLILPPPNEVSSLESLWGAYLVFSYLPLKDIKFLFSALLLEKKLIFFCRDVPLLSATISLLISIIKPFRYTYPIIFNLPEMLVSLCDAPGAALIGINQTEQFFWEEELLEQYPTCTFIFLEDRKIYSLESETGIQKMPIFQDFDGRLQNTYNKHFPHNYEKMKLFTTMSQIKKAKFKTPKDGLNNFNWDFIRDYPTAFKHFQGHVIIMLFKLTVEEKMLKPLQNFKFSKDENEDCDKILKEVAGQYFLGQNRDFLKEFVGSQMFTYFVELFVEKKKSQAKQKKM